MSTLPTTVSLPLMDPQIFDQMQRVGGMLAMSPLFPEHLRKGDKNTAIANGVLVMNMAMRLNEDPLTVAQNIYFVGGKPGWSTSYLIAKANQHGVFADPIDWDIKGDGDKLSVTAKATIAKTGKAVSYTCDMAMAKAEGWTKNAKYSSMPQLMLRYRSATALIRLYCPEVMVGVPAQIEVETGEMRDVTPREYAQETASQPAEEAFEEVEIVEAKPSATSATTQRTKAETSAAEANDQAGREDTETADAAPTHAADPEQIERLRGLAEMIKNDLADDAGVDNVIDLYGPQLEQMKAQAPEVYKDLEAEFAEYRKKEGDGA